MSPSMRANRRTRRRELDRLTAQVADGDAGLGLITLFVVGQLADEQSEHRSDPAIEREQREIFGCADYPSFAAGELHVLLNVLVQWPGAPYGSTRDAVREFLAPQVVKRQARTQRWVKQYFPEALVG